MDHKQTVREMVESLYPDPEVQDTVFNSAEEHGTIQDIAEGRCTLPHPDDALRHHLRVTGQADKTPHEHAAEKRIDDLEKQIANLRASQQTPPPAPPKAKAPKSPPPQSPTAPEDEE